MNSVSAQIQRAKSHTTSNQVLPQIQNAHKAGSGQVAQKRWNVPTEGMEYIAEDNCNEKIRNISRSEFSCNRLQDEFTDQAYDMVTGDNESPIQVPEYLTGRMPSRTHLNQSHDDLNNLHDTTISAQDRTPPVTEIDPINRLADVSKYLKSTNSPTTHHSSG